MLFKQRILDGIARGEITVAFRKWRRPTVKSGGRLRTPGRGVGDQARRAHRPRGDHAGPSGRGRLRWPGRVVGWTDARGRPTLPDRVPLVRADPREALADKDDLAGTFTIYLETPNGPIPLDVWRYEINP